MLMAEAAQDRRLRAPREDGQTLVVPPRSSLADVVARNRQHLAELDYDVQGRPLADLAASARRSLVERAVANTRQYRDVSLAAAAIKPPSERPLIFSGHQPQLFHPGVWYKNFLLGQLASEVGGLGIHLLIDSDLCRSASIRVPTGSLEEPYVESVPFDQPAAEVPYEERRVHDEAVFAGFTDRVAALVRPLVADPVVHELWPLIRERGKAEPNLGVRLAQGRHVLEGRWGNSTLELPQSMVCQLPEFAWFIAHLLAHLPRFWAAHNDALASYRRAHQLRNRAHPVPDLAQADGWLEAPFWLWTPDQPRRMALYACQRGDELVLSDRQQRTFSLPLAADQDAADAAQQLVALAARGIKIRTRALATTLFARLLLSDLFLHGIGGAKYDQVTDEIAERFFGFALPEFATASATLRLPFEHQHLPANEVHVLRQRLRELKYHPERFLQRDGELSPDQLSTAAKLVAEKRRWLQTSKTLHNAHQRHVAITSANHAMQSLVAPYRDLLQRQLEDVEARLRAHSILESREYSFCLYPRVQLRRLLDAVPLTP